MTPKAVDLVTLASARVKVNPSAPVLLLLDPRKMSKDTLTPAPATGVEWKAEPTCQLVAGASCRLGGEAVVLSSAAPFSAASISIMPRTPDRSSLTDVPTGQACALT